MYGFAYPISAVCMFLLSGCAHVPGYPQYEMEENNKALLTPEMGISAKDVLGPMGLPNLNEAYKSLNGKSVVIYFYYTQRKWADGNYTKD